MPLLLGGARCSLSRTSVLASEAGKLELTDGNLSRNISRLEDAGYVQIDKVIDGRRPRTWLSATRAGRKALAAEVAALREIIAELDEPHAVRNVRRPLGEPT